MRPFLPRLVAALAAAAGLLALAGAVLHVPADSLAVVGDRILQPGWHLRRPFAPALRLLSRGHLDLSLEDLRTREGARLGGRILVDYEALPDRLPPAKLWAAGGLLGAAGPALDRLQQSLRRAPQDGSQPAGLPWGWEGHMSRDLEEQGLRAVSIRATGLAPAGDPMDAASLLAGAGERRSGRRILLVGLDGADWEIARPLMKAGRMPALARLVAGGSAGALLSYDPMMSPLLWTTAVTGVGPDRHGIADFTLYRGPGDSRTPITSAMRRVPALWNLLEQAGLRSGWIGWWASYPAESIDGFIASSLVPFYAGRPADEVPATAASPPAWLHEIWPRLPGPAEVPAPLLAGLAAGPLASGGPGVAEREDGPEAAEPFLRKVLVHSLSSLALAQDLVRRDLDLVAVYFEGIDMVGHRFQHCLEPALDLCPPDERRLHGSTVPAFYALQDAWLGDLLEAAGDDWTVILLSDHGFHSGESRPRAVAPYTTGQPVEWHRREGMLVAAGPGISRGVEVRASLFDITPTVMALLGLPLAADRQGRVLDEMLTSEGSAPGSWPEIATYGTRTPPAGAAAGSSHDEEGTQALLAMLQGLGYVESGSAGRAAEVDSADPPDDDNGGAGPGATYYRNLATYHLKRQETIAAEEALRESLRIKPLPKTYQLLAESLARRGSIDEAVASLEDGLAAFPDLALENVLWGVELLVAAGRTAEAALLLDRHLDRSSARPGLVAACQGLIAEGEGREDLARERYHTALAADPTRTPAARRLLPLLAARGEADLLEPLLRRSVAAAPRSDEGWALLGAVLGLSGAHHEAAAALRQALNLDPGNPAALSNLAAALGQAGEHRQAAAVFTELTEARPGDPRPWLGLGTARRLSGDLPGALQAFDAAARIGPGTGDALLGRCVVLLEMGRSDEVRRLVREGLARHPEHAGLLRLQTSLEGS